MKCSLEHWKLDTSFAHVLTHVSSTQTTTNPSTLDDYLESKSTVSSAPFLEDNGLLVMEMESSSTAIRHPWMLEHETHGFTGNGYLRMDGNELSGGDPVGTMSYVFEIATTGKYRMALLAYKTSEEREDWSNDCYSRIIGQPDYHGQHTKLYLGGLPFRWGWASKLEVGQHDKHVATYTFDEPGEYELQISGRSKNFCVSRIVLYHTKTVEKDFAWNVERPESIRKDTMDCTTSTDAPEPPPIESHEERPFLEEHGLIVMEVESTPLVNPWILRNTIEGFTGAGYYVMNGNELGGGDPHGRLSYKFRISLVGQYRMALHSYKNDSVRDDWSNDCYAKLVGHSGYQGSDTKLYLGGEQFQWGWAVRHEVDDTRKHAKYTFDTEGMYELQISGQSKNFHINRIVLYRIGQVTAVEAMDLALPESRREGIVRPDPIATDSPIEIATAAPSIHDHAVFTFWLANANGREGNDLFELRDGSTVNLATLSSTEITIRAGLNVAPVDRVRFTFNERSRTQLDAPYALRGMVDTESDITIFKPVSNLSVEGNKTVMVEAFTSNGQLIMSASINFEIVHSSAPDVDDTDPKMSGSPSQQSDVPSDTPSLAPSHILYDAPLTIPQEKPDTDEAFPIGMTDFTLFNAATNEMIGPLHEGSMISLKETGSELNLIANTVRVIDGIVVVFHFDGLYQRDDGIAPFALGGDWMGDFREFTPLAELGRHTILALAYRIEPNGSPVLVESLDITVSTVAE